MGTPLFESRGPKNTVTVQEIRGDLGDLTAL